MYNLTDPLHFGKYEGFTIKEIYCGMRYVPQMLINDYLDLKLNNFQLDIGTKVIGKNISVKINNFQTLINNELYFEMEYNTALNYIPDNFACEVFEYVSWELILDDSSKQALDIFGAPNDVILSLNNKSDSNYKLSTDPTYINWCIKNLDTFYLNPHDLNSLQNENCYRFHGVNLFFAGYNSRVYKYEPKIVSSFYKFDEEAININEEKFNNYNKTL